MIHFYSHNNDLPWDMYTHWCVYKYTASLKLTYCSTSAQMEALCTGRTLDYQVVKRRKKHHMHVFSGLWFIVVT